MIVLWVVYSLKPLFLVAIPELKIIHQGYHRLVKSLRIIYYFTKLTSQAILCVYHVTCERDTSVFACVSHNCSLPFYH